MKGLLGFLMTLCLVGTVCGLSPAEIKSAYYKSYNYEKMGNFDDAVKAIQLVYKAYPKGYTLNLRLGYLYFANKKYANAISHYQTAITQSKFSIEPKLGLMLVQMHQGKYKDAEESGYQVLNTDFYNYYGNLRLAFVLRKQKKYDLAEKVVSKMLALYPIDTYFLAEYGILKYEQEAYDAAAKVFWDIKILDPENVTANDYLNRLKSS